MLIKKNLHFFILILFLLVSLKEAHADLRNGLIGWWKLNDGTGTTAIDSSGQNHPGTLNNFANPASLVSGWTDNGKKGGALLFDGTNDYISTTFDPSNAAFTLSAWISSNNVASADSQRIFLAKRGAGNEWQVNEVMTDGTISFSGWDNSGVTITKQVASTTSMVTGQWYHVAVTYDGTTSILYINGEVEDSESLGGAIQNTSSVVQISTNLAAARYWNGSIDDVRIYNRALTAQEVTGLFLPGIVLRNGVFRNGKLNQ